MKPKNGPKLTHKTLAFALSFLIAGGGLLTVQTPASAQKPTAPKASPQPPAVPNQILVMVHPGADSDEVSDALKEMNGKLIKTISNGKLVCQLIEVPPGKLDECMDKISKDKAHFDDAQRNVITHKMAFPPTPVSYTHLDVYKRQQWHGTFRGEFDQRRGD